MKKNMKSILSVLCALIIVGTCAFFPDHSKAESGGLIQSEFAEFPESKDALIASIKTHTSDVATYRFEAECTDLSGKSGPGWSGETSGSYTIHCADTVIIASTMISCKKALNMVYCYRK